MKVTFAEGNDFNGNRSSLAPIVEQFARLIGKPVVVSNPHGSWVSPYAGNEEFHLQFWSSDTENLRCRIAFDVFGYELMDGARDATEPSNDPRVIAIKCPEGGIVAEVHLDRPNCLHILYDLPHQVSVRAAKQLEGILRYYSSEFCGRGRSGFSRVLTVNAIRSHQALVSKVPCMLQENRSNIRNIVARHRSIGDAKRTIKILSEYRKTRRAFFEAELVKIRNEAEVTIAGNCIKIISKTGAEIWLEVNTGMYKVVINKEELPFTEICRGPAKAGLAKFIGLYQFHAAFKIIENWLMANRPGVKN